MRGGRGQRKRLPFRKSFAIYEYEGYLVVAAGAGVAVAGATGTFSQSAVDLAAQVHVHMGTVAGRAGRVLAGFCKFLKDMAAVSAHKFF